jgi:hypothetical protein
MGHRNGPAGQGVIALKHAALEIVILKQLYACSETFGLDP